ncbi:hypothetical protein Xen7305DRAFT_00052550 [Xenococcus sp. PCC 7305]|uniref:LppP/LprE family lipoprotein n=1 Tax=Xenococcus sp. PCC 7305 TaxID=102125 RepID=UPI0002ABC5E6|nr:LppP/LprE family lipoprotein [Xenococcus sp. PCC 7305]ELS05509.1 hypothetical protein Xen7305DRAFT_00052550 [Xenococcus sp. PCC 7305]
MKSFPYLISGSLALTTILLNSSSLMAQTDPSGDWLNRDVNWNTAKVSIPQAPPQNGSNLPNCQHTVRNPVLPEDKLVGAAGWTLTGAAQIYGTTTIVMGMANADGMCRPLDYQVFVFANGDFAGTLSPIPMDSRTDGSLFDFNLYRDGFINASFNRYSPDDALCCASGESRVFYEVSTQDGMPLLIPQLPVENTPRL